MRFFAYDLVRRFDWLLAAAVFVLVLISLLTLAGLSSASPFQFFQRQVLWVILGAGVFFAASLFDYRMLRNYSGLLLAFYLLLVLSLAILLFSGARVRGVVSWFHIGSFAIEPGEFVKIILIVILAKYFSRRHVEIYRLRHLVISGVYAALPIGLVLLQPDLGTAVILGLIWLGIVISSGIRLKHFAVFSVLSVVIAIMSWSFLFAPYQQSRIISFINPWNDPRGTGYNAIQSMIAVGSGELWGKGLGYGSQTRLHFLPEPATDFIFAAFAEEWGFIGVLFLLSVYGVLFWRLFRIGMRAGDNFARLVVLGMSTVFFTHLLIHAGMNIGLLPITGITLPFISYGGSSMITAMALAGFAESIAIRSWKSGRQAESEGMIA